MLLFRGHLYTALPYQPTPLLPKQVQREAQEALQWLGEQEPVLKKLVANATGDLWNEFDAITDDGGEQFNPNTLHYLLQAASRAEYLFAPANDALDRIDTWKGTRWEAVQRMVGVALDSDAAIQEVLPYYSVEEFNRSNIAPLLKWLHEVRKAMAAFDTWVEATSTESVYRDKKSKDRWNPERSTGDTWPPGVEDVETLWHVTTNAPAVAATGLKARQQLEQEGVEWGGIGGSNQLGEAASGAISFTGSREWAEAIRDFYLDSMELFTGGATVRDTQQYASLFGLESGSQNEFETWKYVLELLQGNQKTTTDWSDPDAEVASRDLWAIWKTIHYAACSIQKKFCMAVLGTPDNKLAKILTSGDESRIGIVEATIDMTNPSIIYLRGEEEFRVPAEAIVDWKMVE